MSKVLFNTSFTSILIIPTMNYQLYIINYKIYTLSITLYIILYAVYYSNNFKKIVKSRFLHQLVRYSEIVNWNFEAGMKIDESKNALHFTQVCVIIQKIFCRYKLVMGYPDYKTRKFIELYFVVLESAERTKTRQVS